MSPTFTADDVGKSVESADGTVLGVVTDVDPSTAYVDPESSLSESTRAALGWGSTDDAVPVGDDAVARVGEGAIELAADEPAGSVAPDAPSDESAERAEPGDGAYDPGESVEPTDASVGGADRDAGTGPRDDSERTADEHYDAPEGGARVDPSDEMDEPDRSGDAADLESVEEEAGRDLEVDPSELTEGDPTAEIDPREDVGDRGGPDDRRRERRPEGPTDDAATTEETTPEGERDVDVGEMDDEESG